MDEFVMGFLVGEFVFGWFVPWVKKVWKAGES